MAGGGGGRAGRAARTEVFRRCTDIAEPAGVAVARNGTVSMELAATVQGIVTPMRTSAKLEGLRQLVTMLQQQNPTGWRMVVFTGRRETQTTIQAFLEDLAAAASSSALSLWKIDGVRLRRFQLWKNKRRKLGSRKLGLAATQVS
jgi:hypothetical protein